MIILSVALEVWNPETPPFSKFVGAAACQIEYEIGGSVVISSTFAGRMKLRSNGASPGFGERGHPSLDDIAGSEQSPTSSFADEHLLCVAFYEWLERVSEDALLVVARGRFPVELQFLERCARAYVVRRQRPAPHLKFELQELSHLLFMGGHKHDVDLHEMARPHLRKGEGMLRGRVLQRAEIIGCCAALAIRDRYRIQCNRQRADMELFPDRN